MIIAHTIADLPKPAALPNTGTAAGHHAGGGTVASVCAGADALGRAGVSQRTLTRLFGQATGLTPLRARGWAH